MEAEKTQSKVGGVFSTYGLITAQRILERYDVQISPEQLSIAIHNSVSFYHQLLQIPLKNVFNGIILEQANDYHVYAQKLYIDYLISGESAKSEDSQGALSRTALEEERQKLVLLGEDFQQIQFRHQKMIASSQKILMELTKEWNRLVKESVNKVSSFFKTSGISKDNTEINNGIIHMAVNCDLNSARTGDGNHLIETLGNALNHPNMTEHSEEILTAINDMIQFTLRLEDTIREFGEEVNEMGHMARLFRTQFYDTILRVLDFIRLLPENKINQAQDLMNREPLYFDKSIGEPH